jgi:DNA repair exonuclease SbcCD ATPase subunit
MENQSIGIIKYSVTEKMLSELESQWAQVPDCRTKEGYEEVRVGIGNLVKYRTGTDKIRKELKKDALEYGRKVDSMAKEITSRLVTIEEKLKAAKAEVDDEKRMEKERMEREEKERVERIQSRIAEVNGLGNVPFGAKVADIEMRIAKIESFNPTEDEFAEFLVAAEQSKIDTMGKLESIRSQAIEAERQAEEQRKERERIEAEQAKERERMRKEREEFERQQMEAEARRQEEEARLRAAREAEEAQRQAEREAEQRKLQAERERIEAERREQERKQAEEQARIEAERRAIEEEKERQRIAQIEKDKENQRREAELKNKELQAKMKQEAVDAIVNLFGFDSDVAESVVVDVIAGKIPHMTFGFNF